MSTLITPPDQISDRAEYLIVNADITDLEMIIHYLRVNQHDININIYHEGMSDTEWLRSVANNSQKILVNKENTPTETFQVLKPLSNTVEFGAEFEYKKAIDYLIAADKTTV